jgi:hypothetical protein
MKTRSCTRMQSAIVLACVLAGLPAAAQSLLLVVQENANAMPLKPPFTVREGISNDLFDAGYIVLDAPGSSPLPPAAVLAQSAQSAGADIVLAVATDYSDVLLPLDMLRISARTTYALIDAATSAIIAQGTRAATNEDRERDVTRAVLGGEIGKDVADQVKTALSHL